MDQRREFALQALGMPNFRELCREYRISPKTGYKCPGHFSQATGPGRLWISLGAILSPDIQIRDDGIKT
jgi:hypothetical protein